MIDEERLAVGRPTVARKLGVGPRVAAAGNAAARRSAESGGLDPLARLLVEEPEVALEKVGEKTSVGREIGRVLAAGRARQPLGRCAVRSNPKEIALAAKDQGSAVSGPSDVRHSKMGAGRGLLSEGRGRVFALRLARREIARHIGNSVNRSTRGFGGPNIPKGQSLIVPEKGETPSGDQTGLAGAVPVTLGSEATRSRMSAGRSAGVPEALDIPTTKKNCQARTRESKEPPLMVPPPRTVRVKNLL
jgi:hypothetical protein